MTGTRERDEHIVQDGDGDVTMLDGDENVDKDRDVEMSYLG